MSTLAAVNDQNFDAEVLKAPGAVVDFWAEWWPSCVRLTPVMEQLGKEYQGKVKIVAMDVDQAQEVAGALGIMSIPTVVFFKDGKEVSRIVGALPKQRFADEIKARFGVWPPPASRFSGDVEPFQASQH